MRCGWVVQYDLEDVLAEEIGQSTGALAHAGIGLGGTGEGGLRGAVASRVVCIAVRVLVLGELRIGLVVKSEEVTAGSIAICSMAVALRSGCHLSCHQRHNRSLRVMTRRVASAIHRPNDKRKSRSFA